VKSYKHLDFKKRCQIYGLWKAGYNQTEIAQEIGVHKSTISREFNRNTQLMRTQWGCWQYKTQYAQTYAEERHKNKAKQIKFTKEVEKLVQEKLQLEWSPEQISGYGKKHNLFEISHERIYQYILADKKKGGKLYLSLRRGRKKYKKRYGSGKRAFCIKNRTFIDERPRVVDTKQRLGDWEIDTIVGKGQKGVIITLVERLSKKTLLSCVTSKKAEAVAKEVIAMLLPIKPYVLTITADNGVEFAYHEKIAQQLETAIYFAHPYHSWERGLNENTNGLIRQYIPKGSGFSKITTKEIEWITERLNTRPRKLLDYTTPDERFSELKKAIT
jgi:transposase, IS30 family